LATAYSIITRHDGHIAVASEQGQGTTFHVYLPAVKQPVETIENTQNENHQGKGSIIVLDDQDAVIHAIKGSFEEYKNGDL
jgi:Signal transduction histidine kinase